MVKITDLYDLTHTIAADYLQQFTYPWEALEGIKALVLELGPKLGSDYCEVKPNVWIHESATVYPSAYINGPCIIGPNTEVRHCAFVRGSAIVGENCVVGNSTELKNVILFDNVQVTHFNYVGDSILGYKTHMGAGAITSNVRSDKAHVVIHAEENIHTERKKIGAMLGDLVEIGCNSVMNPGTVVGRNAQVYPTSCVRGVVPANSIYKKNDEIVPKDPMDPTEA